MRELRQCSTPEGLAQWQADYRAELASRAGDVGPSRQDALRWLHQHGLPGNALSAATNPDWQKYQAIRAARKWWEGNKSLTPALVLPGPTGSGKSTAACWVALQWAQTWDWNARPTGDTAVGLCWLENRHLTEIGGFKGEAARLLDDAERAHLLVLDDAGKEHTRTAIEALGDVLRARLDRRRLTVLTTNATGAEFRTRYGEPLADRFRADAVVADLRRETSGRTKRSEQ